MTDHPTETPPGLYLHVPFCQGKCRYCDFYSISPDPALVYRWLNAVEREATIFRNVFPPFDTLYLGGGTPSVLGANELEALLKTVSRSFRLSRGSEVTLEANPDDVTSEKLATWHSMGVNRISLGVQSLDEEQLAFLGRRHTAGQAKEAMEAIRSRGDFRLSVDLIYGLPGQRTDEWLRSLRQVLGFDPEHLSCYQLTLAEGTPLCREKDLGRLTLPGEEDERRLFLEGSRFLEDRGYFHYEVSNFAKKAKSRGNRKSVAVPDFEASSVCRHNLKYWMRAPYLGLGPSAHSFLTNIRWWNVPSVERYCEALEAGRQPLSGRETLTEEQEDVENLSLLLRTRKGVRKETLDCLPKAREHLPRLLREGYLEIIDDSVVPTTLGLLMADHLPLQFM